jgi:hypothetical protein
MNAHSPICQPSCDQCPTLLEVANGHPVGATGEPKDQRFRECSFFKRSRSCAVSQGVLARRASVSLWQREYAIRPTARFRLRNATGISCLDR